MSHSIIPPSSAHIWGSPNGCTGWVAMHQKYPGKPSEDTEAGTASHEIGAELIYQALQKCERANANDFIGRNASNGVFWTLEMFDAAQHYADNVIAIMDGISVNTDMRIAIEETIQIHSIHKKSYGTPDCWIYNKRTDHLYIWDYKFGQRGVEIFENWQLLNYLAGIYDKGILSNTETTVHLRIVQPRGFHPDGSIREWVIKASKLSEYFAALKIKAAEAISPDAFCHSGDHCRDCSARHACQAALTGGIQLYEAASKPTPIELSAEAMGLQLSLIKRAKKQLEYLETGFEAQVESLIKKGKVINNWRLENKIGSAKWLKSVDEIISLGKLLGVNLKKDDAVITPTQALKAGVEPTIVDAYSHKSNTRLRLVYDDGSTAKRIFT